MKMSLSAPYLLAFCLFLNACSNISEGEVDYTRTVDNAVIPSQTCSSDDYASSLKTPAGVTRKCYETLYRKYQDAPAIKEGSTISVHMMQGYVLGSPEWRNPYEFLSGHSTNAEVVVIASVCEQGIAGCGLAFGPSSDKVGRVVYFSDGVKAKQYLNFSYLPVYGPIEYKGGPLVVKLSILELDDMSDKQVGLLKSLAEQGKKAYPPASTALTLLDTLGASLLQGSGDDVNFRYVMTLVPGTGNKGYSHPTLSAGNYALLKKDTIKGPQEQEIWKHLKFDHVSGRLVQRCDQDDEKNGTYYAPGPDDETKGKKLDYTYCTATTGSGYGYKDFRERTYLTFQIQTGFAERTLDQPQTLQALINDINAQKDIDAQFVIDATDNLEGYLSRTTIENKLKRPLAAIKSSAAAGLKYELDTVLLEANKFAQKYTKTINDRNTNCPGNNCDDELTEDEIWSITQDARQIALELTPKASIDSADSLNLPPPSTYSPATEVIVRKNIVALFKAAYLEDYQSNLSQYYWEIRNSILQSHNRLILLNNQSKPIEKELANLRRVTRELLLKLKSDLDLFIDMDCENDPQKNACYRLLKEPAFKSILAMSRSIFDSIGKKNDDGTKILVDGLLQNGLDMTALQTLLDDVII